MTDPKWIRAGVPRFRTLTVCIHAALYGVKHPGVQHMINRNIAVDSQRQIPMVRS